VSDIIIKTFWNKKWLSKIAIAPELKTRRFERCLQTSKLDHRTNSAKCSNSACS